jgi:hypothetical protein
LSRGKHYYFKLFFEEFSVLGAGIGKTRGATFFTHKNELLPSQHKKKAEISLGSELLGFFTNLRGSLLRQRLRLALPCDLQPSFEI